MADIRLAARLLAHQHGTALPLALTRIVRVRDDALLLALLGMAGEHHGTVHAFSVALPDGPREHSTADPRNRDDHYRLLDELSYYIGSAWQLARDDGTHPQIFLSSPAAAAHLRGLAERLCRAKKAPARMLELGERLAYFADRAEAPGQQAVIVATDALRAAFTTGMAPAEEQHLGAMLEWIEPGAGGGGTGTARERAARAELLPAGPATCPEDDLRLLQPALDRHVVAVVAGDLPGQHEAEYDVSQALRPALAHQARLIETAVRVLRTLPFPELPDLARPKDRRTVVDRLVEAETDAFAAWCAHLDADGHRIAFRDTAKAAAYRLAADGPAADNLEAAAALADPVARETAVHDGLAVRLKLTAVAGAPAPRKGAPRRALIVGTPQGPALPRPGQTWRLAAPGAPRWHVTSVDTARTGPPLVTLTRPGPSNPHAAGDTVDLVRAVPEWGRPRSRAVDLARRSAAPTPLLPPRTAPTAPEGVE